ncbi:MAG TPA: hypothetical protein VGU46_00225 [Acidobacteriaceae bacterium]|nr:hypothetical protein [Acidobacteriaceae bacterium]
MGLGKTLGWMAAGVVIAAGLSGRAQVVAVGTLPAAALVGAKVFPLAEVRRGMHGVAYTVFEGVTPEPMEVEILGVLKDAIGPGQDMILARLKGRSRSIRAWWRG